MSEISKRLDDFFSRHMPSLSGSLRENRLERMNLLLEKLGNPERSFRTIHVAGSKGKGTTSTCLSFMLTSLGHKTGLFLSPHVYDIRERFTLSSVFFSDEEYLETLNLLSVAISNFTLPEELGCPEPTTFELYTAYAYLLFSRCGCEWAVIETGLGGRLDATNTISSDIAVITEIELEHTRILGSTLSLIAKEKAGIIKKNKPTFVLSRKNEVIDVMKEVSSSLSSPLTLFLMPPLEIEKEQDVKDFPYLGVRLRMKTWQGDIRLTDAFFAAFILSRTSLLKEGYLFDFTSPLFHLPGRCEERQIGKRTLLLDGAHTVNSVTCLRPAIEESSFPSRTLIFSASQDKNWKEMLSILVPLFDSVIITSTGPWKKSYPEKIYKDALDLFPQKRIEIILSHEEVLKRALAITEEGGLITATGSFYLLGELDRVLKGQKWQ